MVAYSFKPRFVLPIELGEKRQTIRGVGKKRHARAGDTLQLYTGPRMKPRKIGEATCESAEPITLNFERSIAGRIRHAHVVIGDPANAMVIRRHASASDNGISLDDFAKSDGFASWAALASFWSETHGDIAEWHGVIIRWGDTFRGGLALNPPAGDPS